MAKKVQYTTNTPSSTTDYLAADNTWKAMTGGGGGVPYTGATSNVDLGEFELKAGQLELDQTPTGTAGVAVMRWNDSDGTVDIGLKGGNVTLQVGQEEVIRVVNKTGSNLLEANYQCVRVRTQAEGGAQGQRLAVKLAQADTKANHTGVLGLVTETINNNQEGFITTFGYIRGVNTTGSLQGETWLDGDVLWLSDTTAGGLTNIQPTTHPVQIGYVVYAHGVNGKIFVRIGEGVDELDELHDVAITTPSNGQVLTYETASGLWKNQSIPATSSASNFFIVGSATGLNAGLTRYGNIAGSTAESQVRLPLASACTISHLYVRTTATMNALASLSVTLFKNGSSTALTLTIAGGSVAATYSNTANSVTFAAGDGWTLGFVNAGTLTSAATSGQSVKITI
jgi:hypothetical protein